MPDAGTFKLKYSRSFYQNKIAELQGKKNELDKKKNELLEMKNALSNVYRGSRTADLQKSIQNAIDRVEKAANDVDGLRQRYEDLVTTQSNVETYVDSASTDITTALNREIDVASIERPIIN